MRAARLAAVLVLGLATVAAAVALSCLLGAQPISLARAMVGAEPDRAILLELRLQTREGVALYAAEETVGSTCYFIENRKHRAA